MRLISKIRSDQRERSMIYVVWFGDGQICVVVWFWVGLICDQGVQGVQDLSQDVQKYFKIKLN